MEEAEAPGEEYQSRHGLNQYFWVRPEPTNVVPNTEQQNYKTTKENRQCWPQRQAEAQVVDKMLDQTVE